MSRGFVATALVFGACDRNSAHLPAAAGATTHDGGAPVAASAPASPAAGPAVRSGPVWPDGWVVVSEEEWIPVLDKAGRELQRARAAYVEGDESLAATQTEAAAATMRLDADMHSAGDRPAIRGLAADLDALAAKLRGAGRVTMEELDKTFTSAYRTDAVSSYLYMSEEALVPTFEQPRVHFERALKSLDEHDPRDAADEIRRGTGFFRLASRSARSDDRAILDDQVANLEHLAVKARAGELDGKELKRVLANVDAAYASSYLHQAEKAYNARESRSAIRALKEAVARIRARAQWLGAEVGDASNALADELERLAGELGRGVSVTASKIGALFRRSQEAIQEPVHASSQR